MGAAQYEQVFYYSIVGAIPHELIKAGRVDTVGDKPQPYILLFRLSAGGAGIHPGSESGTCFRTNRSFWLAPAHQGIKLGALVDGRVQVSSVPPHPTPPLAGDKPQRYISLIRFSAVVATRMVVGVAGRCRNPSRIGVRDMLS